MVFGFETQVCFSALWFNEKAKADLCVVLLKYRAVKYMYDIDPGTMQK